MKSLRILTGQLLGAALLFAVTTVQLSAAEGNLPATDQRGAQVRDLNTLRTFPAFNSTNEWIRHANGIRGHILVNCGLYPLPGRGALKTQISDKIEHEDYSVEKVMFQSYPGFYVAGNLYRPLRKGNGPFPAVLNPHGHWAEGRLADTADGSIPARCIQFARMGMVAFSYDMVGYNDSVQATHKFAQDPTNQIWGISLMGLQLWNSMRALDFLESLPEVDKTRLACTGESGGGTQTFMLGAVDNRLAVQAPIVMVSHSMQGGCLCENAPGLRIDYSNMEIAAVAAPRPQIIVGATGDWTRATLTVEGPALASIYKLFNATNQLRYTIHNFNHNYNQTTREDVYGWFDKWLNLRASSDPVPEKPYKKEPDDDLRVFPGNKLPADAINESQLTEFLMRSAMGRLASLQPTNEAGLNRYQRVMITAWRHSLQVELPATNDLFSVKGATKRYPAYQATEVAIGRRGRNDRINATLFEPVAATKKTLVILANPDGQKAFVNIGPVASGLASALVQKGLSVLVVDVYRAGDAKVTELDQFKNYFNAYNRTVCQERVQDLITACGYGVLYNKASKVVLCGTGRAGLYAMLAAPAADAVVADCDQLDYTRNELLMKPDLFYPGLKRFGGFEGMALLAAPNPLFLFNSGERFPYRSLESSYAVVKKGSDFKRQSTPATDDAITEWIQNL